MTSQSRDTLQTKSSHQTPCPSHLRMRGG